MKAQSVIMLMDLAEKTWPDAPDARWDFFRILMNGVARAVEPRDEAVAVGQPCPSCNGYGELRDEEAEAFGTCPACDGTGWA